VLTSVVALDRWFPFHVTLDVSTAWTNLKFGQWVPLASFGAQHWLDVLVTKLVWIALLAALLRRAFARAGNEGHPRLAGALIATAAVLLFEIGKLGFVGRRPSIDAVLLGALGALAGVTVVQAIVRAWPVRRWPAVAVAGLALALLAQAQLTPFHFVLSRAALSANIARVEWLPLSSYYGADAQVALHDLVMKLLHGGFLGLAFANLRGPASGTVAGAAGLVAALLLETAQLAMPARHPSVTDVLAVAVGAGVGGRAHALYSALRRES
jgi:VanZ family protein